MTQSALSLAMKMSAKTALFGRGRALGLGLVLLATAAPAPQAFAQSDSPDEAQLQVLVKELNSEFERGERERLIDPWFLRDLRQLLSRYDNPWNSMIFEDDFSSRSSRPGEPWQVVAGEMLVDWRYGMRSLVRAPAPSEEPAQSEPQSPLRQIFGALLGETGNEQQGQQAPAAEENVAAAVAAMTITNAFAIRLELTSRPVQGVDAPRFEFGPYQGEGAAAGYRLALQPGISPSMELVSVSSRGTVSTIEMHDEELKLDDSNVHVVEWTRDRKGRMVVRVDGAQIMDVVDRRFSDSFDGFSFANRGGDVALRSIRIDGTNP
jgi:hypothetical protein